MTQLPLSEHHQNRVDKIRERMTPTEWKLARLLHNMTVEVWHVGEEVCPIYLEQAFLLSRNKMLNRQIAELLEELHEA